MSLSEMTITPTAAPAQGGAKPAAPTSFVRGSSAPAATLVHRDGKFSAADGSDAAPIVRREGGAGGAAPPKDAGEILKRFGATWAQDQAPAPAGGDAAKPAEAAAATPAPADTPKPPAAAQPGKEAASDPAKPAEVAIPGLDELKALFGDRKPAEVKEELERYAEANRKLVADLEAARKAPPAPAGKKYAGTYIDNSNEFLRQAIADELGIDDPQHADVTAELQALTLDLNAAVFGAPLDTAQQAARDAAKARQALARDKRTRTAQGDSTTSSEEAATKQATAFIGNRLSATRTGPDGKALPSMREQFPLAGVMAARIGVPLEEMVYRTFLREKDTGRLDPKRINDDDYVISEAARILESQYQDLADALGKARTPSTATPPPQQTPPAPAPAANASASQGQPQGHGGRTTLTAADGSVAPPTPPATPAPKAGGKKLQSRSEFFDKWYPKS